MEYKILETGKNNYQWNIKHQKQGTVENREYKTIRNRNSSKHNNQWNIKHQKQGTVQNITIKTTTSGI